MPTLHTARLELIPADLALLDAELEGPAALAQRIGAEVGADWPPGEHDRDAVEFFREQLLAGGEPGWFAWYARLGADLVGAAGYFGPPADGAVEIGYSVCASWRRRGVAREMVDALCARAFAAGATRVLAHCAPDNAASIAVLRSCGFTPTESRREGCLGFIRQV